MHYCHPSYSLLCPHFLKTAQSHMNEFYKASFRLGLGNMRKMSIRPSSNSVIHSICLSLENQQLHFLCVGLGSDSWF